MRQTLIFIPHELAGIPVFGFGWLLAVSLIICSATFVFLLKKEGWNSETKSFIPFSAIVLAIIAFVLPAVEVTIQSHEQHCMLWTYPSADDAPPLGLPIRGYGVFLLIATVSGVLLARFRAKQVGLSPDAIYNLAFYMFVGGILGARLFFVIQKWDEIHDPNSIAQTMKNVFNFVEGGLVVYGSLMGALVAAVTFLRRHRLPILPIADLIAPSLALGLAIGRIGCLMNGCCFGGPCEHGWAIEFPQQSPAYYDQHAHGAFYGFTLRSGKLDEPVISSVFSNGAAAKAGIQTGETLKSVGNVPTPTMKEAMEAIGRFGTSVTLETSANSYSLTVPSLPTKSLPVHPTQLYSSFNALLLAALAFAAFPHRRRDGEVFALLMCAYAITRFLLEVIRTDESSFSQTGMTISQNVSIGMLVGVGILTMYLRRQPPGTFWPTTVNQQ